MNRWLHLVRAPIYYMYVYIPKLVAMQKKIIIVGATSGIGREMALCYLRQGAQVGITGRRQPLLQQLKEAYPLQVATSCFDVADEKAVDFLLTLIEELGGLDLFIYNAGYGEVAKELNPAVEWTTMQTNVAGLVRLSAHVFTYYAQRGGGQLAFISSVAALRGNSWAPAYSASKAFSSTYAEGLNLKALKLGKNIVVTDVRPGFIATKPSGGNRRFWVAAPQTAAHQIITAIGKRKKKVYITRRWWLVAQLLRNLPYAVYKRLG